MAKSTTSSAPLQCQVVLSLAHLLHQQSPRYDIEKNALLYASSQCALQATRRQQQRNANDNGGSGGEVHLFLTGSPRPTFAETNAWLLDSYRNNQSPANMKSQRNKDCRVDSAAAADDDDDDDDDNGNIRNSNMNEKKRKENDDCEPLVGHAVVNAISQSSGVGLKCIRSQMLQGTIDRPEWDQTRWTDGECLFSELVGLVGLESFEGGSGAGSGTSVVRGKKATDLSANLITVSASASSMGDGDWGGMGEVTFEEIARNILRCLRRRRDSPPASVIHVLLPPDELDDGGNNSASSSKLASSRLMEAFHKLEKYNDMIGVPRLMANATLEVVHASTFAS